MSLRFSSILEQLHAAGTNDALLALAVVDIAFHAKSRDELATIRETLILAAVPRWCDPDLLSALLRIDRDAAKTHLNELATLEIVERFPARGSDAVNVHEATRRVLRNHLCTSNPARFQDISRCVADFHSRGSLSHESLERTYHLFAFDPSVALRQVEEDVASCLALDDLQRLGALSTMLDELLAFGSLDVAASIEAILVALDLRNARQEISRYEGRVRDVLKRASDLGFGGGVYDANRLLGEILIATGHRAAALEVFHACRRVAEANLSTAPADELWLRRLAMAYRHIGDVSGSHIDSGSALEAYRRSLAIYEGIPEPEAGPKSDVLRELSRVLARIGRTLERQGKFAEAMQHYEDCLRMARGQVESNKFAVGWQASLADAVSKVGGVLEAQGEFERARALHLENLEISRRLYAMDPVNPRLRSVAAAHSRVGDILERLEKFDGALEAFEESLAILRNLSASDPDNMDWRRDVAIGVSRIGFVKAMKDDTTGAEAPLQEYLEISRHLVATDSLNSEWQRGLAVALSSVGDVFEDQGRLDEALAVFCEYREISEALVLRDAANISWQRGLALAHSRIASVYEGMKMFDGALEHYRRYLGIIESVSAGSREIGEWRFGVAVAHSGIARVFDAQSLTVESRSHLELAIGALEDAISHVQDKPSWRKELAELKEKLI